MGNERTKRTYYFECWRATTSGILETAGSTFLLLIAVRWYAAGSMAKALVAGGGSLGLLFTPWIVTTVTASGWRVARAASVLAWLGAGAFLVMAMVSSLPVFVVGSVLAMAAAAAAVPLMTQIYQENYPDNERGRLFSRTVMIRIATAALFSELAGRLLSGHGERHRWLLGIFALAFVAAALLLGQYPSRPLQAREGTQPWRAWRSLQEDRLFRHTLMAWMLMGFANLMMFPMRVEYLANPHYGPPLSIMMIALLTGVIPNIARLILSPVWGWLFDHMNFFTLRVILNLGFALGIITFFMSRDPVSLFIGAVVFGIANAGGDVAWSLWVTKFAPADRVADYMAVHTFFTGVRGLIAPWVAFHLVAVMSMAWLGWLSAALIGLASLMLVPEIRTGRNLRPDHRFPRDHTA